jgi:tetratricopeptide (TPR) repeat protein
VASREGAGNVRGHGAVQPVAAAPSVAIPARIGPFIVDRLLAQGGMGTVYDAHDEQGRRAAVKVIHAHLLHVADVRARFVREAQATQRLDHPNVVRVLGVGNDPAYLAVEFVDGGTVGSLLERHGRLPLVVALELFAQMIAGLAAAHERGVVHRDLKPDNLLLSREGALKIADFGIARELDATAMTQTGSTLGTPAYMSPEQARAEVVDPRSDLYTAGVILYELLVGRNPFVAESIGGIIGNILRGKAAPLFEVDASVPDGVEALVSSLMHRDRDARPPTAAAVLAILRPIVDDVRRLHPRLIADVMQRPARAQEFVKEQADALVTAARVHLQSGAAHREAAALCLFRAQVLVPEHADARALLDGLAQEGVAFGKTSAKLAELEREIAGKPDDAVLLQRAAQLARQEGELYKAAIYLRRYLRVRPDDNYVRAQADKLTLVVPAPSLAASLAQAPSRDTQEWKAPAGVLLAAEANDPQSTMMRIAGHVVAGGFVAAAPHAPPTGQTQRLAAATAAATAEANDETPGALAALWYVHKWKLIGAATVIVLLVGGVRLVRAFIDGAQKSIESSSFGTRPVKARDPEADEIDLKAARAAFDAGNTLDVEKHAGAIIARGGKGFDMSEALVLRGKSRLSQNRALAAVEDFTRVLEHYGNEQQAAREALLQRGIAYVKAGDHDSAKEDFTRVLTMSMPPVAKARAHLERGLIALAAGDVTSARKDLEKAETYTPPGDETHVRAVDALERLPK